MRDNNELQFKRADLLLMTVLLMTALVFFLYGRFSGPEFAAAYVTVSVDGAEYGRYSLQQDAVIKVDTGYGCNELTISKGSAGITYADCTGEDCMHMPPITADGGTIICLPHHMVICVDSEHTDMDVLVR